MEKPWLEKNVDLTCSQLVYLNSLEKNFAVEYNASDRTGPQPLLLRSGGVMKSQVATQYLRGWYSYGVLPGKVH